MHYHLLGRDRVRHMSSYAVLESVLYHGYEGTAGVTGFPNTGTWLIFGVVLVPIYAMVVAWFTVRLAIRKPDSSASLISLDW
ncbi:hypothetical protein AArcMg_1856 [Natrarchaeobaculum sulfurireducens]|uniref:Uncharacterized protein n=1 Tax=Natrarchaeobaculum sulfurireducens TaxID=2044521 RepID=A0A346PQR8_9EURY|nr:hypothetical protein AArcMg_1856 [Natrarchaeobaculum sulfurireducens]